MTSPNPTGICVCGCGRTTPVSTWTDARRGRVKGEHARYAQLGCQIRARSGFKTVEERFASKVDRSGGPDACWPWLGHVGRGGQGQFGVTSRLKVGAHRFAYSLWVGPIPAGLDLDHVCHTNDPSCNLGDACPHRSCCNPRHLEPVTKRENLLRAHGAPSAINARKTHCSRGHEFAGANLTVDRKGKRTCRTCRRMTDREWKRRARAALKEAS